MEILEVTLSITNIEAISGIIVIVISVFGAPYLVRAENKKRLDKKADITELTDIRRGISAKVDQVEYDKEISELKSDTKDVKTDLKDHIKSNETQFGAIQLQLSSIQSSILDVLKEVKRS